MDKASKIYIAGHQGMVGSAIKRRLHAEGYVNLVFRTHAELDLTNQLAVEDFMQVEKPDYIFLAAGKVGGIHANQTYPADFIYQNLMIQTNVIHSAWKADIQRLLYLGSSCIYPRECPQPIKEEYLLTGPLERTNEAYAVAKIAGLKLCESYNHQYGTQYTSIMPTNLYGPNDNYDLNNSHVLPALIRKAHEAKINGESHLVVWGSGRSKREFLFVDDLADASILLMETPTDGGLFNVGTGKDITIHELVITVMSVIGFEGDIVFDNDKPDGTPRKLLNIDRMRNFGWSAKTSLQDGIARAYKDFLSNVAE